MTITQNHPARIGPNAINRIAEAITTEFGEARAQQIFSDAGLAAYLSEPPEQMVEERDVSRLHQVVRSAFAPESAAHISWMAGSLTADYLLAHRIPTPAQRLLRLLPPRYAARQLLSAIAKHAWTFAGSGTFRYKNGHPTRITITGCPICADAPASDTPVCDYYAATFAGIFSALVSPSTRVVEVACQATGSPACVFEISWRR